MNFWTTTITLFLIIDPVGNIPAFQSILENQPEASRRRIILRELLIALAVLLVFLHAGHLLLAFLGLSESSLGIAGGIILFLIALRMVFPGLDPALSREDREEPFIVPLAIPLVAGPSAIAFLMLLANTYPGERLASTAALLLGWFMASAVLLASPFLLRRLHRSGIRALVRLMGMILVMVGVEMFLDGVASYLGLLQ